MFGKYTLLEAHNDNLLWPLESQDNSDLNFIKTLPNDILNETFIIHYITLEYKYIWALFKNNSIHAII